MMSAEAQADFSDDGTAEGGDSFGAEPSAAAHTSNDLDADDDNRRSLPRPAPAEKRSMADLLRTFDPQNPPSPSGPDAASLHDVQLWLECEAQQEQVERYHAQIEAARSRGDHASLTPVQRQMLAWYPALRERIEAEQKDFLHGLGQGSSRRVRAQRKRKKEKEKQKKAAEESEGGAAESESEADVSEWKRSLASEKHGITRYGPFLCALQPEKLAVIASHEAMSRGLKGPIAVGVKTTQLAIAIGEAVEAEVHVQRLLRERLAERAALAKEEREAAEAEESGTPVTQRGGRRAASEPDPDAEPLPGALSTWTYTPAHLQAFVDELSGDPSSSSSAAYSSSKSQRNAKVRVAKANQRALRLLADPQPWHIDDRVRVGAALLQMLMEVATVDVGGGGNGGGGGRRAQEPAFRIERLFGRRAAEAEVAVSRSRGMPSFARFGQKKGGPSYVILHERLHDAANDGGSYHSVQGHTERHRPMVVPPRDWVSPRDGGYAALRVDLMRRGGDCREQLDALRGADLSLVYGGLNSLGRVPWKINHKVLEAARHCWKDDVPLGDIPSRSDFDVPAMPEAPERPNVMAAAVDGSDAEKEGEQEQEQEQVDLTDEEAAAHKATWRAYYIEANRHRRFMQKNMDLNSLRCSAMLKLGQAETFRDFEEIFFPYNVDFRGRAYPVPPHLSNVGSDLCRGLLTFAEAKPLGEKGLFWLKVHLANLAGADKMPFEGRAGFTDDHMADVRAAVDDPFGSNRWWTTLDDPFQGLAACHEICNAIDSGDPASYECSLPVHMDGSCNGLQHYAALGRDRGGGKAVNLCVSDTPQDVYVGVMREVIRRVEEEAKRDAPTFPDVDDPADLTKVQRDALNANASARLVHGLIDRGVVKRTVMTSVYGVTFIGAKNQIREKIEEKLEERGDDIDELEKEIHGACNYLARVTIDVMGDLFVGARSTMGWLAQCARLIAAEGQPVSWITPVGIPAVQPYRQKKGYTVTTLLQRVLLTNRSDDLPVHRSRQVTAFPPNYVHSLDSSHMILTALEMERRGLAFSAVHDSFWTHACDVDEMNGVLRDAFVELHGRPLLDELKTTWELRYPGLTFPDVPEKGDLDLGEVRDATYFFQ